MELKFAVTPKQLSNPIVQRAVANLQTVLSTPTVPPPDVDVNFDSIIKWLDKCSAHMEEKDQLWLPSCGDPSPFLFNISSMPASPVFKSCLRAILTRFCNNRAAPISIKELSDILVNYKLDREVTQKDVDDLNAIFMIKVKLTYIEVLQRSVDSFSNCVFTNSTTCTVKHSNCPFDPEHIFTNGEVKACTEKLIDSLQQMRSSSIRQFTSMCDENDVELHQQLWCKVNMGIRTMFDDCNIKWAGITREEVLTIANKIASSILDIPQPKAAPVPTTSPSPYQFFTPEAMNDFTKFLGLINAGLKVGMELEKHLPEVANKVGEIVESAANAINTMVTPLQPQQSAEEDTSKTNPKDSEVVREFVNNYCGDDTQTK
jgi:hypothetical protein